MLTGTTDHSESGRQFLQSRMASFGRLLTAIVWGGVLLRLVGMAVKGDWSQTSHPAFLALAGMGFLFGGLWWMCRRDAPLTVRRIQIVETAVMVASAGLVVWACQIIPLELHPPLHALIFLSALLYGRTFFIPSTARRTMLLGLAMAVPLALGIYTLYASVEPAELREIYAPYREEVQKIPNMAVAITVWTVVYFGGFVALCTLGARVIYGLRKEARNARMLGQYTLQEKLGAGGMGEVWLGKHALLRRPTAIKLMGDHVGEKTIARFEREVQLTARLTHPNTVTIYDFGRTPEGAFYYVMELLDSGNLEDLVAVSGAQPPERVVHIMRQVAGALAEAHGIGLIHRDIKPANIMLCFQGGKHDVAKLVDFGLVKDLSSDVSLSLSSADTISGTPLYMSPEAISNPATVDHRADIYALGCVAYFLLTGAHVFGGNTVMEVCVAHLRDAPRPPSERLGEAVPEALEMLIMACLEKGPGDRPQSAAELETALRALALEHWDGAWWWDEFGHLMQERPRSQTETSQVERSLEIDYVRR